MTGLRVIPALLGRAHAVTSASPGAAASFTSADGERPLRFAPCRSRGNASRRQPSLRKAQSRGGGPVVTHSWGLVGKIPPEVRPAPGTCGISSTATHTVAHTVIPRLCIVCTVRLEEDLPITLGVSRLTALSPSVRQGTLTTLA